MRISDWSSDVCSSDLSVTPAPENPPCWASRATDGSRPAIACRGSRFPASQPKTWKADRASLRAPSPALSTNGAKADRKRVVQGKRLSVRLDLGGRRFIKKQRETQRIG